MLIKTLTKRIFVLCLLPVIIMVSCNDRKKTKRPHYEYQPPAEAPAVKKLNLKILRKLPHQGPKMYTQGFEISEGILYESTGEYNLSSIKKMDLKTGKLLLSKDLKDYFAEGITMLGGIIYQLTYREGKVYTFSPKDFSNKDISFTYQTEGWGLANNGSQLIMSDGSDKIYFRNPMTFNIEKTISVTYKGNPLEYLNELEYVDGKIYANVYGVSVIMVINAATGVVESEIDCASIDCAQLPNSDREAVLNGIAYNPDTKTFYITGKRCPNIYEVVFE